MEASSVSGVRLPTLPAHLPPDLAVNGGHYESLDFVRGQTSLRSLDLSRSSFYLSDTFTVPPTLAPSLTTLHLHLCLPSWSSTPHEGAADSGGLRRLQASLEALVEGVRALRALASLTLITHEGEDEWRSLVAITPALMRAGPALRRCSVHKYVHHLDGEEGPAGGFTRTYTGEAL